SIFAAGTLDQIRDETTAALIAHGHGDAELTVAIRTATGAVLALGPTAPVALTDLPTLFRRLVDGGLRCAVVTSDDRASTEHLLTTLGVASLVATMVGGDETERPKPFPDPLFLAGERLGTVPPRLLMVGDSAPDQGAARAAGCPFVAVGRGTTASQD